MNRARAQYTMRHPRRCKVVGHASKDTDWQSWYYVEAEGIDVMVRKPGAGTVAVKLTARQLRQALNLIRDAHNGNG